MTFSKTSMLLGSRLTTSSRSISPPTFALTPPTPFSANWWTSKPPPSATRGSRMGKRFRKANRDIAFFEVSGTFIAAGAQDSTPLVSLEKSYGGPPGDRLLNKDFKLLVRALRVLGKRLPTRSALKVSDEQRHESVHESEVQRVRTALALVHDSTDALKASMPVLDLFSSSHDRVCKCACGVS